jgi:zinc transport system substrate-binding protein
MGQHHAGSELGRFEADHTHGEPDPHIWLSPPLVMIQVRRILTALQAVDPAHRTDYEANYKGFILELVDLDAELRNTFVGHQGLKFLVFHPSWGYFAQAYGLQQLPVEAEGKDPKPAQLTEIIEYARRRNIRVVFVQPQFSTKSAAMIAKAIGAEIVFADPLAEDWAVNLRHQARKFKNAMKKAMP